jgi:hypothetical protein
VAAEVLSKMIAYEFIYTLCSLSLTDNFLQKLPPPFSKKNRSELLVDLQFGEAIVEELNPPLLIGLL